MSAKPLPSTAEADELSAPAKVVEVSVDELSDEDVVAAALPSSVRMMGARKSRDSMAAKTRSRPSLLATLQHYGIGALPGN